MRSSSRLIAGVAALIAAMLCVVAATFAATMIEKRAAAEVRHALAVEAITWTDVRADGLLVHLTGTAPTEAIRFRALSATGKVIDAARVIDEMDVTPAKPVIAPDFSLELLRNAAGVSIIGLIPSGNDTEIIRSAVAEAAAGAPVTDMMDSAGFPEPEGWSAALSYSLKALKLLPRAKISVSAKRVIITAITDSAAEKTRLEAELAGMIPEGIALSLEISAPRPVITPFTLRFLIGPDGARFDACSADTAQAEARIVAAAQAAGLQGKARCTIGLGVPSPDWAQAVETGIAALAKLGGGSLTFSDADVYLVALDTTPEPLFDRIAGELEADLPEVFSLHAELPEPVKIDGTGEGDGPPEFVATKSPEGLVQLRGRVPTELTRTATESYARSRFGLGNVYAAMRVDDTLPDGWPLRVLTSIEALAELNNGSIVVQPDFIELRGVTGDPEAQAEVARILADKLGESQNYQIDVRYEEALDPVVVLPTPEECVATVNEILSEQKITFEPGSTTLQGDSLDVVDRIAEAMRNCPDARMEIGGHTDSQGREEMNQSLSQQRANAVLNALAARRILTSNLTARGYGEAEPIAENDTEEGREANRRIEFRLLLPEEDEAAAETTGDAAEAEAVTETSGDAPAEEDAEQTEAGETDEQN